MPVVQKIFSPEQWQDERGGPLTGHGPHGFLPSLALNRTRVVVVLGRSSQSKPHHSRPNVIEDKLGSRVAGAERRYAKKMV